MNEIMLNMAMQLGRRRFKRMHPPYRGFPLNVSPDERAYRHGDDNVLLRPTQDYARNCYGEQHGVTVIYHKGMLFQALGEFDKEGNPLNEDAQKLQTTLFVSLKAL